MIYMISGHVIQSWIWIWRYATPKSTTTPAPCPPKKVVSRASIGQQSPSIEEVIESKMGG